MITLELPQLIIKASQFDKTAHLNCQGKKCLLSLLPFLCSSCNQVFVISFLCLLPLCLGRLLGGLVTKAFKRR